MFKKKSLSVLIFISFFMLLVACGGNDDQSTATNDNPTDAGEEGSTDPVTYHYFIGASGSDIHTNETEIGGMLEDETGVNFQMEYLVGDLMEKLGVMVAGGQYPDVVVPDHGIDMMLDADAFIPLNDLLEEHGQNILAMYDDYLDRFTMPDGNIYYIPFGPTINEFVPNPNIDQGAFWIQRGVLKEYDFPEINTLEEYFDVIKRYADENPQIDGMNTVPFTGLTYDTSFFTFSNVPNHLAGFPNDGGVMVDLDTHEASVYADSEYAKRYLQALNELNDGGYLDQEMFVMNTDDYLAKLSSGRVLGFFDYGWQFGQARVAIEDLGDPEKEYMALPVVLDESITDQYIDPPSFTQNRGVGITVSAENPERIIQYWDRLIQEDMQKLVMWGEEERHYSVDEDGRYYRTDEQVELAGDQDERRDVGMTVFEWNWPRLNGSFNDGNAVESRRQPEVASATYDEEDRVYLDAYGIQTFSELFSQPQDRPWYPAWSANIEQGSDVALFSERSEELTKRHYPRIVLANPTDFEDEWATFEEAYRNLDVDVYEEFFTNTVRERINGNWQFR
ncbi:aldotetraouronic acid ABC transporter substrate-binding protein [Amphibacillus marinus]|uniref:Aldotetraouronic acid ABC transporter substrate-binding protein n=1 Tax=Amphibacillus marinus TaxID=872970 RepID=A0A1H8K702_9BACI|nr:extracellular solute-binding protein [Amphibacillus marinus]SEN88615.1 aldotetraouronic acid ABC transporter substrate-binding protein [Amphibacillus marinus]